MLLLEYCTSIKIQFCVIMCKYWSVLIVRLLLKGVDKCPPPSAPSASTAAKITNQTVLSLHTARSLLWLWNMDSNQVSNGVGLSAHHSELPPFQRSYMGMVTVPSFTKCTNFSRVGLHTAILKTVIPKDHSNTRQAVGDLAEAEVDPDSRLPEWSLLAEGCHVGDLMLAHQTCDKNASLSIVTSRQDGNELTLIRK